VSVNYFPSRECNYSCGFCFHTAKTSFILPEKEAKRGLTLLKEAGMKKINFSGGEPFLHPKFLGSLVKFCKVELQLESVTIISNGSKIKENWLATYGEYLDILAVSCDSFSDEVNQKIGRASKAGGSHLQSLARVRSWCVDYNVLFKLNTVVNSHNWEEDMIAEVRYLQPVRWKVFQCLAIEAENKGTSALRRVEPFLIEDDKWEHFLERHAEIEVLVPESNEVMRNSYLLLDEYMRFLDNTGGSKAPSNSILDVGVDAALNHAGFDERMFYKRGGKYQWSKAPEVHDW